MKTIYRLRVAAQILFLLLLAVLVNRNRFPLEFPLPVDFFLRIDPLAGLTALVSARALVTAFWPALIVIASSVVLGKFFCGWICPLGAALDVSHRIMKKGRRRREIRLGYVKYMLLTAILVGALFSFQFCFFFDPLVIICRTATIAVFPITYYFAEETLAGLSSLPLIGDLAFDLYAALKGSILPVQSQAFRQTLIILAIFVAIILLEKLSRRFWCRNLCPLGALLGILSKFSPFGRWVGDGCSDCSVCGAECKMGAIDEDFTSNRAECILCLNCYFACPDSDTHFGFQRGVKGQSPIDLNRRRFVTSAAAGLTILGLYRVTRGDMAAADKAIRPPGAVPEDKFLDLCLRCQECVGVCASTGACLQPAVSECGLEGLWTPVARMREGYCEYNCNLCGKVCPSGAIEDLPLEVKQKTRMGMAFFDKNRCIPYYKGADCLVCEEHCPTPDKAIKFKLERVEDAGSGTRILKIPYVVEELCIGCGICEHVCPVTGKAGIFITPANAGRNGGGLESDDV